MPLQRFIRPPSPPPPFQPPGPKLGQHKTRSCTAKQRKRSFHSHTVQTIPRAHHHHHRGLSAMFPQRTPLLHLGPQEIRSMFCIALPAVLLREQSDDPLRGSDLRGWGCISYWTRFCQAEHGERRETNPKKKGDPTTHSSPPASAVCIGDVTWRSVQPAGDPHPFFFSSFCTCTVFLFGMV